VIEEVVGGGVDGGVGRCLGPRGIDHDASGEDIAAGGGGEVGTDERQDGEGPEDDQHREAALANGRGHDGMNWAAIKVALTLCPAPARR
jgi:hypothetical protein